MLVMLEKKTLIMIMIFGGLWWSHLYQIQLLVISSRRAFRRDPEQQYNQITGEKNFRETKWFMNGGDGKPEDTGSLPLSRDRLDHDTPPPPSQPGKLLSFLKIDRSQKLRTVHKLDLIRMTSTRISREKSWRHECFDEGTSKSKKMVSRSAGLASPSWDRVLIVLVSCILCKSHLEWTFVLVTRGLEQPNMACNIVHKPESL